MAGAGLFRRDDELSTLSVSEGSLVPGRVNDQGAVWVAIASGGSGGAGDASAANQDEQTALLTTIDADTTEIATSASALANAVYTEAETDATINGIPMLWEDTSDTLRAVSAANPLPVSVASIPSHAVTNAGTFAVQIDGAALTALQLIDNLAAAISGSEMQVDVVGALPAGTNAIGKLAANSGVDIGDVDDVVAQGKLDTIITLLGSTVATQVWKSANYTTAQTGAAIWTPGSGKKIAITHLTVSSYGTTAARLLLWFGASGDTTYTAGTDQLVLPVSLAPSSSGYPGVVLTPASPILSANADYVLRITTDAALSVDITVYGYEFS